MVVLGELRIIGNKPAIFNGDQVETAVTLIWRADNQDEVTVAGRLFKEYVNKGWLAIGEIAGKKSQIFTFNPDLDRIVLTPLLMGG